MKKGLFVRFFRFSGILYKIIYMELTYRDILTGNECFSYKFLYIFYTKCPIRLWVVNALKHPSF
jgi:hypothetical protein